MFQKTSTNQRLRKVWAVLLTLAMIVSTFTTFAVNVAASTQAGFSSTYFKTNPNGYGANSSITIDGSFNDWNSSMLIAQGVANDDARAFRGTHEGPVYDTYALYSAWDDKNLYFMWEFTNVTDVVDPAQGYPISDNGKPSNGDIPQILALDIDPSRSGDGTIGTSGIWGMNVNYQNGVDTVLCFSSKPGVGTPAIFTLDDSNSFSYETEYCTGFKTAGVTYAYGDGHISDKIMGIKMNGYEGYTPRDLASDSSNWVDMMEYGHDKKQDTMYEMAIPLSALGIDKAYLETYGIGAMHISTFGQSGITSIPADASMVDNAAEPYSCDESTSAEKEDTDVITCDLARVGRALNPTVVPTVSASVEPSIAPTVSASVEPSVSASVEPSPSIEPSVSPSVEPSILPTITPSILPTVTPSIEPENTVTIYYKSSNTTYMHYRIGSNAWTTAPGVLMNDSNYNGYKTLTINLGSETTLSACFNDGNGNWDNNNKQDYHFTTGTYQIKNGTVIEGAPVESHNTITLYYKTDWTTAYVHYKAGDGSWTTAPGVKMSDSNYSGYKVIILDIEDATTLTCCFNNGSGNWDSNGSKNYYINTLGSFIIQDGTVTAGIPEIPPVIKNTITIYYQTDWTTPYCHYQIGSGAWTAVPGVQMTCKTSNEYAITIDLGQETTLNACFNNGYGSWDNHGGQNYHFDHAGTYMIRNGVITELGN